MSEKKVKEQSVLEELVLAMSEKIENQTAIIERQSRLINDLGKQLLYLEVKIENLNTRPAATTTVRDRGPISGRTMTEDDARKIMLGELKDKSHREAAEILGLSYGQVYSARGGFTFKGVYKEKEDLLKAKNGK